MATSINSPSLEHAIRTDIPAINVIVNALAKGDPSVLSDLEIGTKRVVEGPSGWEFQQLGKNGWVTLSSFNIDAQRVDGFEASANVVKNTIPVRDAEGKIPGDISGTATSAESLTGILNISGGGTGASSVEQARSNLGVPPTKHSLNSPDYGTGTNTLYGHLKLSDSTNLTSGENGGIAATPKAVKAAYDRASEGLTASTAVQDNLDNFTTAQAAKDAEQDAAIAAAQSGANAAQSSADAAQSSADAAIAGLEGVVRSVNGVGADAAGNVSLSTVPTGSVIAFAQGWIPNGFLLCNGAAVSRSTYANLFAHIGTIYGAGDGSTTFNLPQLADGRFIRGASDCGVYLEPGLPNIWGVFSHSHTTYDQPTRIEGAFATISAVTHNMRTGDAGTTHRTTDFNAARSNGHFGRYEDVIPRSLHMMYGIKY